jgi:hypothetical protein
MLAGIWRNDDLHLFPWWTSALGSPHHACILATLLSFHYILSVMPLWWNHFCSQLETSHKKLPKKIWTKRTLPTPDSSLPFPLRLDDPLDIGTATKENIEESSSSLLCVWMRGSEWLFIGWEEEWRPLNMPCQWSVCLFTLALGSNSHKMDGGDRLELCFLACQYYVSDVINRWCPCIWKVYFYYLKSIESFTVAW